MSLDPVDREIAIARLVLAGRYWHRRFHEGCRVKMWRPRPSTAMSDMIRRGGRWMPYESGADPWHWVDIENAAAEELGWR
jgi:hypothetical protein